MSSQPTDQPSDQSPEVAAPEVPGLPPEWLAGVEERQARPVDTDTPEQIRARLARLREARSLGE